MTYTERGAGLRRNDELVEGEVMSGMVREVTDASFAADVLACEQPVVVFFWAQWSAPSRMQAPTIEAVAEKYCGSAAVVRLDADDNPHVSQRYDLKGLPTLILFRDGMVRERVLGPTSKEAISRMIDKWVTTSAA